MKNLLIVVVLGSLVSCRFVETFGEGLGDGVERLSRLPRDIIQEVTDVNPEESRRIVEEQSKELREIKERLNRLERITASQDLILDMLTSDLYTLGEEVGTFEDILEALSDNLDGLRVDFEGVEDSLAELEGTVKMLDNALKEEVLGVTNCTTKVSLKVDEDRYIQFETNKAGKINKITFKTEACQ